MIYSNAQHNISNQGWHSASPPLIGHVSAAYYWCADQTSNGKFFKPPGDDNWCFERAGDALMFSLVWSGQ